MLHGAFLVQARHNPNSRALLYSPQSGGNSYSLSYHQLVERALSLAYILNNRVRRFATDMIPINA